MPKHGFLLGKFMPTHLGHLFLIQVASRMVDELSVLLCSRDCEPIDGKLRFQWLQDSISASHSQNVKVLHMHRDIPQEPADHADFWSIWRDTIYEFHPEPIDMVFASEDYGIKLAQTLDAEAFIVDKNRNAVPISATNIRHSPEQSWPFIPIATRPYYQKRFVFLGAESTGKSTFTHKFSDKYKTISIDEYGRDYDVQFKNGHSWEAADFHNIITRHHAIAEEISARAGYHCFEDTDVIQTLVWWEYLLNSSDMDAQNYARLINPSKHYIILDHQTEWIDDGTRYSSEDSIRKHFTMRLQAWLEHFNLKYSVVHGGDHQNREAQIEQIIKSST